MIQNNTKKYSGKILPYLLWLKFGTYDSHYANISFEYSSSKFIKDNISIFSKDKNSKSQPLDDAEEIQDFSELQRTFSKNDHRKKINISKNQTQEQIQGKNHRDQSFTTLQTFKLSAQKIGNFQQLLFLYRRSVDQENFEKYFVAASINFSRIIRRFKSNQYHDVSLFLGNNYQLLKKIRLEKISIEQLAHISNLLNIIDYKLYLNTTNLELQNFIQNILNKVVNVLNQRRMKNKSLEGSFPEEKIQQYRDKSIACKMLRTSQIFMLDKHYETLLQLVIQNMDDLDLFEYLSIFNTLLRNNSNSKVNKIEIKFLKKAVENILRYQWIQISSVHSFCDLVGPILTIIKNYSFIYLEEPELFKKLWEEIDKFLLKKYQQISGQEIIRLLKIIYEVNPNSILFHTFITKIFHNIQYDGHSNIDPIFIIRLLGHNRQFLFTITKQKREQIEEKLICMVQHYFIDECIRPAAIVQGLNYLVLSGNISKTGVNRFMKIIQKIVLQNYIQETDGNTIEKQEIMTYRNRIDYIISAIKTSLQTFSFQYIPDLLEALSTIRKQNNIQLFYYYAYLEFLSDFLRKNGVLSRIERLSISKSNQVSEMDATIQKTESTLGFLKSLYSYNSEISKSGSRITRLNFTLLNSSIMTLKYTLKYHQILSVYQIISRPPKNLANKLILGFIQLPVPVQIQEKLTNTVRKNISNSEIIQIFFNQARNFKNTGMRVYRKQAIWLFMLIAQKISPKDKHKYYSDVITLTFLLRFLPSQMITSKTEDNPNNQSRFVLMDEIMGLPTQEQNFEGIFQTIIYYYQLNGIDAKVIQKNIGTITTFMKNNNYNYNEEIKILANQVLQENGTAKQNNNQINLFKRIITASDIINQKNNSNIKDIQYLIDEFCDFVFNSEYLRLDSMISVIKLLNYLQDDVLHYLKQTIINLLPKIIVKLKNQMPSQESHLKLNLSQHHIYLMFFSIFPKLQIHDINFFQYALKLIQSQQTWKGFIVGEQLFEAVSKNLRYYLKIISVTQLNQDTEKIKKECLNAINVLAKLFLNNPEDLYHELFSIVQLIQSNDQLRQQAVKLQSWNYLIYLKQVPTSKLTFNLKLSKNKRNSVS